MPRSYGLVLKAVAWLRSPRATVLCPRRPIERAVFLELETPITNSLQSVDTEYIVGLFNFITVVPGCIAWDSYQTVAILTKRT
jgi:hypothetical protein